MFVELIRDLLESRAHIVLLYAKKVRKNNGWPHHPQLSRELIHIDDSVDVKRNTGLKPIIINQQGGYRTCRCRQDLVCIVEW